MTHPPWSEVVSRLREVDERLRSHVPAPSSLDPGGREATSLGELGAGLLHSSTSAEVARAFGEAMARLVDAQLDHFPETIFWDFDYLAACLVAIDEASRIDAVASRIVTLQRLYGRHSSIRFRYVHDFLYGFDWAKWVQSEPASRAEIGPFDEPFLSYLCDRAGELVDLIDADDVKYPKLLDGRPRNPFGFSREPDHERRLHLELSRRGLIPVASWCLEARPVWDRPYARLREEQALMLGLPGPECR